MTNIGFISLGCPKNQVDTEVMLKLLSDAGYRITADELEADIIIINTCAFIESAKQEAIDNIIDTAWLMKNRTLKGIAVCGCLAQRYADEIKRDLPEVGAVVGVFSLCDIVAAVQHIEKGKTGVFSSLRGEGTASDSSGRPDGRMLGGDRILTTPEYTAYLKISEGCDNRCSYCAIPYIRGSFVSRPMEDIEREASELAELGVRELVVVAQDTTRYGEDIYGKLMLPELLKRLCKIEKLEWIRLLYCYPDRITDELCEVIANETKIIKYIDLPIQHISDKILSAMNRRGGSAAVKSAVARLRAIPGMIIRTTVLVGFPGEGKAEYGELMEYLKEAKFDRLGAFAFSDEEGTPAHAFGPKVSPAESERRRKKIMLEQERINYALNQKQLGKAVRVLTEGFDKVSEAYYGRTYAEAPEIDGKMYFTSKRKLKDGEFVTVKVTEVLDFDLYGDVII